MKYTIDKADSRGHAVYDWLDTYHTFSFAGYYNPHKIHFGALRVLNDDIVKPGKGFGMHQHQNMEIVSIPLLGHLRHQDSIGNVELLTPGMIQVMSAGTGIS
ncbi:MAG: pirin family protein, partial [Bacteroidales bacterium]